jgi:hypothetical protein
VPFDGAEAGRYPASTRGQSHKGRIMVLTEHQKKMIAATEQLQQLKSDGPRLKGIWLGLGALEELAASGGDITDPVFKKTVVETLADLKTDVLLLKGDYDTLSTLLHTVASRIIEAVWRLQPSEFQNRLIGVMPDVKTVVADMKLDFVSILRANRRIPRRK